MRTRTLIRATLAAASMSAVALAAAVLVLAQQAAAPSRDKPAGADAYRLSGPYTQDNLTIFLIHGPDRLGGQTFLTLPEALEQKKFVIHETQQVNQLTMENLSPSEGGHHSCRATFSKAASKTASPSLTWWCRPGRASCRSPPSAWNTRRRAGCGRSRPRTAPLRAVPTRFARDHIRLANRYNMNQGGRVEGRGPQPRGRVREKLKRSKVKAKESDSSLALSQQIKEVRAAADAYVQKLNALPEGKADVIGYAFAINGKVLYADVYGSRALFQKVWPRLLRANAIEAVAQREKGKHVEP